MKRMFLVMLLSAVSMYALFASPPGTKKPLSTFKESVIKQRSDLATVKVDWTKLTPKKEKILNGCYGTDKDAGIHHAADIAFIGTKHIFYDSGIYLDPVLAGMGALAWCYIIRYDDGTNVTDLPLIYPEQAKAGGDIETDFAQFVSDLNDYADARKNHGDTVAAFNKVYSSEITLSQYSSEKIQGVGQASCIYGCAMWMYNHSYPYHGQDAWEAAMMLYQECLLHCGQSVTQK